MAEDAYWIMELRAVVLRPDLERLGRFDPIRVRQRFLDAFIPAQTRAIVVGGDDVGVVTLRSEKDAVWLEHFYIDPSHQGKGIGNGVLSQILSSRSTDVHLRLNVLRGSAARRLYERHGFVLDHEDSIDVYLELPPREIAMQG
ncbi:GNAT family N-acetyltransferase [Microbacterium sp. NPDC087665]|uniref:GNAT family N-acetyltransferase n=1 Tax=Microbacterium sp. NPDC087665 TaxID=3364194 RepID=UPI0037FF0132